MLATEAFDKILDQIKTSGLNFQMQISPYSAAISLKKSLTKDQSGKPRIPPKPMNFSNEETEAIMKKNKELEKKVTILSNKNSELINDCSEAYKRIENFQKDREKDFKAHESEMCKVQHANKVANEAVDKLNKVFNESREKIQKEKSLLIKEHKMEIKVLKKDLDKTNKEMIVLAKNLKDLEGKDAELEEVRNKNLGLEEKLISLLDVLYGCEECGRHGDYCECNYFNGPSDSIEEKNVVPVSNPDPDCPTICPLKPPEISIAPQQSLPASTTPPWTPPATPPCSSCGGDNYGPSPASVCFGCISPLKIRTVSSSAPSTTPPGTPPPLRGKHDKLGNMPAIVSKYSGTS